MLTIVQQYDSYFSKLAKLTTENKLQYANKYGHAFLDYQQELNPSDAWYWHNTLGILKAIHDTRTKGEWIFWTDVDSLIMNMDFDIEAIIKSVPTTTQIIASLWCLPSENNLYDLSKDIKIKKVGFDVGEMYQIHTGNFLVRRSTLAVSLLKTIYEDIRFRERPEIIIPGSGDESAYAIYYLGYPELRSQIKLLDPSLFCTVPKESNDYIQKFNMNKFMQIKPYSSGDFILHALGRWKDLTDIAEWKYSVLSKWILHV
jgi:hypothetical protein